MRKHFSLIGLEIFVTLRQDQYSCNGFSQSFLLRLFICPFRENFSLNNQIDANYLNFINSKKDSVIFRAFTGRLEISTNIVNNWIKSEEYYIFLLNHSNSYQNLLKTIFKNVQFAPIRFKILRRLKIHQLLMTGTILQVQKFFLSVRPVFKNQTSGLRSLISIFRFVIFVRFHFVFFYFLYFPKRYYCNCWKICVALLTFLSGKFKPKSDILRLKISESKYKIKG